MQLLEAMSVTIINPDRKKHVGYSTGELSVCVLQSITTYLVIIFGYETKCEMGLKTGTIRCCHTYIGLTFRSSVYSLLLRILLYNGVYCEITIDEHEIFLEIF